jgi:hypothetical protein
MHDGPMTVGLDSMARSWMVAEQVRDRCRRFAAAMDAAGVPYAVIGGNAVAAWVDTVEPAAARATNDVDVLLRRDDLPRAIPAASAAGFVHSHIGADMMHVFKDHPEGKTPRRAMLDAVHVIFAAEKVRPTDPVPAPDVTETITTAGMRVLTLEALVRMKLTAHRLKDRVHIQDLIGLDLLDATWPARLPPELGARLQAILVNPDG